MKNIKILTYNELSKLPTFKERYNYLRIGGRVGRDTFGFDRYMNQAFYKSREWKQVRDFVIVRDHGCDLGMEDYEIYGKILIHHMNPITPKDIQESTCFLLNPDYLISVSHSTHNAIHYGDESLMPKELIQRRKHDTCPWRIERKEE